MPHIGLKPGLMLTQDRWGCWMKRREVSDYGWVEDDFWARIQLYQSEIPKDLCPACVEIEIQKRMNACGGSPRTLWQFNMKHRSQGLMRMTVALGVYDSPKMVEWSWFDRRVRRPFLVVCAWFYNRWVGGAFH